MLQTLINISGKKLLIPLYHTVSDNCPLHIKNLYPIKNIKAFEDDLDSLLKYFTPIEFSDLIEGKPLKRNSLILTFDDGLREVYDVIVPILLRKGIPAAFFVNTDFVNNKDLFFRYKASVLIELLGNIDKGLREKMQQILNIKLAYNNSIKSAILKVDYMNRKLLDTIANILGFSFKEYLKEQAPYLSLNQLIEIQSKGFVIGAHSIDHPEYFKIPLLEQLNQTIESVNWVKKNLQPRYNLFAFPFTDFNLSKDFFDKIFTDKKADLHLSFGCAGLKDDYHKQHLQRVPMEVKSYSAEKVLKKEYRNYLLKSLISKNKIRRK
ncbi:MAG TPA: polysaccharide deacetylase family protein [Bacteroidales bacterium]|nr:polysaccharide deacetylase family protein [Bacteroidales bacterium]